MRKIQSFIGFVLLTLLLTGCAMETVSLMPQPNISDGFEGIWEGSGIQYNDNSSWTIKVTIVGDQYFVEYPSLNCGGKLDIISSNLEKMEFREHLSYGKSNCVDNGKTVIVKVESNRAQYQWYYPNGKKGATGTLTRR